MGGINKSFKETQKSEADSWLIKDEKVRRDKALREAIRYPLLKKQMGLDYLDTSEMTIFDIGAGPLNGVSSIMEAKNIIRFEPLKDEYAKYYPLNNYSDQKAEDIKETLRMADLIIVTNALDHFEDPQVFLDDLVRYMKPGAFFAHLHAIDNSYSHPHEAHAHSVNPEMFHEHLGEDFETVWYMDYRQDGLTYGWKKQKAFSGLYRKTSGYV